ncbi:MAG: hypothetical protein ABR941_11065 [Thermoleophilia bacterium]
MASCAVCGTGLREGATHCTTCGTPTGTPTRGTPSSAAPPTAPAASAPSPFASETSWIDPPSPFDTGANWDTAGATPPPAGRTETPSPSRFGGTPPRSGPVKAIVIAAVVVVVAALVALVAVPRLFPSADPQKYVGTWAYTGNTADKVVITRQGDSFTIVFVGQNGQRQSLPGMISDKKLVIDYGALGPQGETVEKLAESLGARLSFSYRGSDDRLLLSGTKANEGSFTIVMERS